jgi:DNA-nicking Smr family endonuclease
MLKRTKPSHISHPLSGLASDDIALLNQAFKGVIPLAARSQRVDLANPQPKPTAKQKLKREAAQSQTHLDANLFNISDGHLSPEDAPPITQYSTSGVSAVTLRKLKRGFWPVTASLDLHGMTVDTARARLSVFIQQAQLHNIRCVRVVHGQGLGSISGHGRLKHHSRHWLTQMTGVNAFIEAPNAEGGAGAVLVLLGTAT